MITDQRRLLALWKVVQSQRKCLVDLSTPLASAEINIWPRYSYLLTYLT